MCYFTQDSAGVVYFSQSLEIADFHPRRLTCSFRTFHLIRVVPTLHASQLDIFLKLSSVKQLFVVRFKTCAAFG
jgi:hypothetical protein